jgi:hypothetical protein
MKSPTVKELQKTVDETVKKLHRRSPAEILKAIVADVEAMRTDFPPAWENTGDKSEEEHWFGTFETACANYNGDYDDQVAVQWPNLGILIEEAKESLK